MAFYQALFSPGKDGLFGARFTDKRGKRRKKDFKTLPEAGNRLADVRYEDKHNDYSIFKEMKR